jgi:hypothetical protein
MYVGLNNLGLNYVSKTFSPASVFNVDSTGLWVEAYDPNSLVQRRNLLSQSSTFITPAWAYAFASYSGGRLVGTTDNDQHFVVQEAGTIGDVHSFYIEAKAAEYSWVRLASGDGTYSVWFDLSTGTVGTNVSGVDADVEALDNGYYRCRVSNRKISVAGCYIFLAPADGVTAFVSDSASGVYLRAAQCERGTVATTYQEVTDWYTEYIAAAISSIAMWQDLTGSSPVTAVGQTLAMDFDKSNSLLRGPELAASGQIFTAGGPGATGGDLSAIFVAADATAIGYYNYGFVNGEVYEVVYTISDYVSGTVTLSLGGASAAVSRTANGTYTERKKVDSNALLYFASASASTTATATLVSLKKISGNHLFQSTAGSRPVVNSRVNQLSDTPSMTSSWFGECTITEAGATAPDGTLSALKLTPDVSGNPPGITAASNNRYFREVVGVNGGWVNSVYFKTDVQDSDVAIYVVDRASDTLIATTTATTNNTWQHLSVSGTTGGVEEGVRFVISTEFDVLVWGPDSRMASDADKGFPVYQRVVSDTDYDTVGFPTSWQFDGVDDGILSAAFSAGTLSASMDCFVAIKRNSDLNSVVTGNPSVPEYFGCYDPTDPISVTASGVGVAFSNFVDGVAVANTRQALSDALGIGEWHVLEVRDLDLSGWLSANISGYGGWLIDGEVAGYILCESQSTDVRAQIRRYLGNKVGLTL